MWEQNRKERNELNCIVFAAITWYKCRAYDNNKIDISNKDFNEVNCSIQRITTDWDDAFSPIYRNLNKLGNRF